MNDDERRIDELRLREREVVVKEQEFILKETEQKNRWRNPVFVGLLATALSIAGSAGSAAYQSAKTRELESQKFQDDLVLGALNTSDPKVAAARLGFLRSLGYVVDKTGTIEYYIGNPQRLPLGPWPGDKVGPLYTPGPPDRKDNPPSVSIDH